MHGKTGNIRTPYGRLLSVRLVSEPGTERPELELTDEKGKRCLRGYFEHCEVLSPQRETRLAALYRHPEWWDGQPDGVAGVERRLAEIEKPHRRTVLFAEMASASADDAYQRLAVQWRRDRGAKLVELLPPAQQSILDYLRLGDLDEIRTPDLEACWRRLEDTVPADRGLFERLRRFSLLPCPLPEQARDAVRALSWEDAYALLERLAATLHGPIGRLHLLDLALTLIDVLPESLDTAQAQVDHLLSAEGETEVRLLASLADLNWRALDNVRAEEDQATPAQLLSSWVHASFVADLILSTATDAEGVVERLRRWSGVHHRDLYSAPQSPRYDLSWLSGLAPAELSLVGLGSIMARYPDVADRLSIDRAAERISSISAGRTELPHDVMLLRSPYLPTDRLGCLWGGDRAAKLLSLAAPETAAYFSAEAFDERVDVALGALKNDPSDFQAWVWLSFQVGYAPLRDEAARCLNAILEELPVEGILADARPAEMTAVVNLAVINGHDRDRIADCLLSWAENMDSGEIALESWAKPNGADAQYIFADQLIQWSLLLASRNSDDPDSEFARLIDGLMMRSKRVCQLLIDPLRSITRMMPFTRHKAMHHSLLCARSRG